MFRWFARSTYSQSFSISVGIHALLLFGGGWILTQKAEFGMEVGLSSLEVNLVANEQEARESDPITVPPEQSEFILQEKVEKNPKPIAKRESSPHHGHDSVTLQSSGGAITEARPDYLKNPPPSYPEIARRKGQEGLVLLSVRVGSDGRPLSIEIRRSSNVSALDQAALKAVQKWRFSPAKLGSLSIESQVDVPIRFRLNE